jgi:hypothetical protein
MFSNKNDLWCRIRKKLIFYLPIILAYLYGIFTVTIIYGDHSVVCFYSGTLLFFGLLIFIFSLLDEYLMSDI